MQRKPRIKAEFDQLLAQFALEDVYEKSPILEKLTNTIWSPSDGWETMMLHRMHTLAATDAHGWNEEELKMKLLAQLFQFADIDVPNKLKSFYERTITVEFDNFIISQKVDCMFATPIGHNTPGKPFFFMQEFKREKGDKADPKAQMLAAMLAAQHLNADGKEIYGSYVMGRYWFFAVLQDQTLHISRPFIATNYEDLLRTVAILCRIKELILVSSE